MKHLIRLIVSTLKSEYFKGDLHVLVIMQ